MEDEVAFGFNQIDLDFPQEYLRLSWRRSLRCCRLFHIAGKVLANETVEQCAQHILLKIPAINRAAYIVGDLPNRRCSSARCSELVILVSCRSFILSSYAPPARAVVHLGVEISTAALRGVQANSCARASVCGVFGYA